MAQKPVPIHHHVIKRYSQSRGCYDEPLLPRLRSKQHDTYAVGFKSRITSSDDDFYPDIEGTPIGFTRGLTRPRR
jgi:hypothetical protein